MIVEAASTAVTCKSTGLIVGVAFGTTRTLQALMINVITSACVGIEKCFKWMSPATANYTGNHPLEYRLSRGFEQALDMI